MHLVVHNTDVYLKIELGGLSLNSSVCSGAPQSIHSQNTNSYQCSVHRNQFLPPLGWDVHIHSDVQWPGAGAAAGVARQGRPLLRETPCNARHPGQGSPSVGWWRWVTCPFTTNSDYCYDRCCCCC